MLWWTNKENAMDLSLMNHLQQSTDAVHARRSPPALSGVFARIVIALLAALIGASTVLVAGGSLLDGRTDGPGLRATLVRSTPGTPTLHAQPAAPAAADGAAPAYRPNTASSRSSIARWVAGSTKLASKLLRASA